MTSVIVNNLTATKNLVVRGPQTVSTLTLNGIGTPNPALDQALVVKTGAAFKNLLTVGSLEVTDDVNIAGTLTATTFGVVTAPSVEASGHVQCTTLSTDLFSATYYVAPVGDDIFGNGSLTSPFKTINHALSVGSVAFPDANITIVMATGVYRQNVLINSLATIVSPVTDVNTAPEVVIEGNVVVDIDVAGLVSISGVLIRGYVEVQGSAYDFRLANSQIILSAATSSAMSAFGNISSITLSNVAMSVTGLGVCIWFVIDLSGNIYINDCTFNVTKLSTGIDAVILVTTLESFSNSKIIVTQDSDTTLLLLSTRNPRGPILFQNNVFQLLHGSSIPKSAVCIITISESNASSIVIGNRFDVRADTGYCLSNYRFDVDPIIQTSGNYKTDTCTLQTFNPDTAVPLQSF